MRILLLTNRIPFPLNDGGNVAVNAMIEGLLEQRCEVDLLSMNTSRHFVSEEISRKAFQKIRKFYSIDVDNTLKPFDAILNLFSKKSYNISRFVSVPYAQKLKKLLQSNDYDIVQMEGLFVTPYFDIIQKYSKAKITYRQHNIEYLIWERLANDTSLFLKKSYLKLLAHRLKKYELSFLKKIDFIIPISEIDAQFSKQINTQAIVKTIGYGISKCEMVDQEFVSTNSCYHIGAMDWLPNKQGIEWFLRDIWPLVIKENPDATFYFGGRNLNCKDYTDLPKNTICLGDVEDLKAFLLEHQILVVPLLSASGIRIKIIQAMANGKTIIATKQAVEGLPLQDGKEISIAEDEKDFAQKIIKCITDKDYAKKLSEYAFKYAQQNFDNELIIKSLVDFYKTII